MSTLNTYNLKSPDSASTNLALDASGNVAIQAGSASAPSIYVTGDANTGIYSPGADQVAVTTGGSARLYINSSGNVGIGTNSAGTRLHVSGTQGDNSTLYITSTDLAANNGGIISIGGAYDGSGNTTAFTQIKALKDNATVGDYGGSLAFFNRAGAGGLTEKARIDSSGRLLVGTSSARSNLFNSTFSPRSQVEGTDYASSMFSVICNSSGQNPWIVLGKSSGTTIGSNTLVGSGDLLGGITFQGNDGSEFIEAANIKIEVDGTPGANDMPGRLVFSTTADGASSPTERMRISQAGNVYFASTTDTPVQSNTAGAFTYRPSGQLEVNGNGTQAAFFGRTNDGMVVGFYSGGTRRGDVSISGSTCSFNNTSDYRLKENVVGIDNASARLTQLKPCRFNFIDEPTKTVDGFLAHEAQAVVPEAVTGTKDAVDTDGNPVYQGIDQSKLVPLLTAALQEALAKIETLEVRLTAAGI